MTDASWAITSTCCCGLDQPNRLSALLAGLLRAYVHHCHRRHRFVGHRFQGRFKSPAVQDGAYLLSCGRYIERNPVEARLVKLSWDYRWSSCRAYALGQSDPLVSLTPEYLETSLDAQRRQEFWRDFLLRDDPRQAMVACGDWAIGDDDFLLRMRTIAGRPAPRKRGRPRKLAESPDGKHQTQNRFMPQLLRRARSMILARSYSAMMPWTCNSKSSSGLWPKPRLTKTTSTPAAPPARQVLDCLTTVQERSR